MAWITKWQKWVQGEGNESSPGAIDNHQLVEKLAPDKSKLGSHRQGSSKQDSDRPSYFNISKHLYFFFACIYGGGPIICKLDDFYKHELDKETKVIVKPLTQKTYEEMPKLG
jgi:hypothetical protein